MESKKLKVTPLRGQARQKRKAKVKTFKFLLVLLTFSFLLLPSVCFADLAHYFDYLDKNRDHFGIKKEDTFGMKEKFFVGGDINDLGISAKACVEKKEFLDESETLGAEVQEALLLNDKRYKQRTAAAGLYLYSDMAEHTRFSTELKYSRPTIYDLHDTIDPEIEKYKGGNDVMLLLLRGQNAATDNDDYPTRGRKTDAGFEISSNAIGSDFNFLRTKLENAFYYTPIKLDNPMNKLTFMFMQQAGWMAKTNSDDDIPFFERFYAGGTTTVRGYRPRYLAPRDSEDEPIGGDCMAAWTVEARYPVWRKLSAALFYDQGNAWAKANDMNLNDTKIGVGSGLRWVTNWGTARLDYGYGLNENTRQRGGRVHASLGVKF